MLQGPAADAYIARSQSGCDDRNAAGGLAKNGSDSCPLSEIRQRVFLCLRRHTRFSVYQCLPCYSRPLLRAFGEAGMVYGDRRFCGERVEL